MNINYTHFSRLCSDFFKKNVFPSLIVQRNKLLIVSSVAFGCLTAYCLIPYFNSYRFKANRIKKRDQQRHIRREEVEVLEKRENRSQNQTETTQKEIFHHKFDQPLVEEESKSSSNPSPDLNQEPKSLKNNSQVDSIQRKAKNQGDTSELQSILTEQSPDFKNTFENSKKLNEQEKLDLQNRNKRETLDLEKEKAKYSQLDRTIFALQIEIDFLKNVIDSINKKLNDLKQGTMEEGLLEVAYLSDDEITLASGNKVKASQYIGKLTHQLELRQGFSLISEKEVQTCNPHGKLVAVERGSRYTLREIVEENLPSPYKRYIFETEWKGDGVLPWIKITQLRSNADVNQMTILQKENEIQLKRKELTSFETRIADNLQKRKISEEKIKKLNDSLAKSLSSNY